MSKCKAAAWGAWAMCVLAGVAFADPDDGIVREGEGDRRTRLNARELKPFDAGAWASLSDWKNGEGLSAASTTGKPVLIMTWTDYIPASRKAFALAEKLAGKHAGDGLIVVCAHGPAEWASARKPAPPAGGTLLLAHDAKGEFRAKINADNDPDFYVIDRAGQLRFADIVTESVEGAVAKVRAESRDAAGGVNDRLAQEAKDRDAAIRRAEAMRSGVDLTTLPNLPFEAPPPEAYEAVKWPALPKDPQQAFQASGPDDKPQPQKITIPESGWYPEKPNLDGRVVMFYFWHPDEPLSFKDMHAFDLLQKQYGRDLVVVGVLSPLGDVNNQDPNKAKIETDPEKLQAKLDSFRKNRTIQHPLLLDVQGTLLSATRTYYPSFTQAIPVPWVAIVSTDSMMRWWGWQRFPAYQASLDKVLAVNPAVQARRKVEAEYLRAKQGRQVFEVVLVQPEIPNNTGNIGRTCVAAGCGLHLVHPLGFEITEKACRRAGLDYWPRLRVREHASWAEFEAGHAGGRLWLFTTKSSRPYFDADFRPGDALVFGRETKGLDPALLHRFPDRCLVLPMAAGERSLNVATAVCAVVYEGVRQVISRGEARLDSAGRLACFPHEHAFPDGRTKNVPGAKE